MVNKKVRRNVLALVIIAVIAILVFIVWTVYQTSTSKEKNLDNKVIKVSSLNQYYELKACINKFYEYLKDTDYFESGFENIDNEEHRNKTKENVFNLLDEEYINLNNITKSNIKEKIPKVLDGYLQINRIYRIQKQDNLSMYLVFAEQIDTKTKLKNKFNIAIKTNHTTNRFSVYFEDYITTKGYDKLELNSKNKIELSNVANNTINNYSTASVSEVTYIEDMFEDYRYSVMHNRERAYRLIDDETKKSKFTTFDEYNKYVKENLKNIITMKIKTYRVERHEKYTDYLYVDTYGKEYIFRVTDPFSYTIIIK